MSFVRFEEAKTIPFEATHLVVSGMGMGSVGTLAVDLLIVNSKATKVGYFATRNVSSVVGNLTNVGTSATQITLPVEISQSEAGLTFFQIRSSLIPARFQDFFQEFMKFVETSRFKSVIVITAQDRNDMPDKIIVSSADVCYAEVNSAFAGLPEAKLFKLETLTKGEDLKTSDEEADEFAYFDGLRLTRKIAKELCSNRKDIPLLILFAFGSFGYDLKTSEFLARKVLPVLNLPEGTQLSYPRYWARYQ
eukprot:TRINITY_DN2529_c0_g2_i2.p1 TRINITY_DN2529_c0_g2~~TRINITY_DN2529_c0_g2_i2.p1  ORF type:complete len:249 (+),score=80.24 TRINITY_DN2529_c0_g2_i2:46-792(+)